MSVRSYHVCIMIVLPEIDPIAFRLGVFPVRWYGLTYQAGFVAFWGLGRLRAARVGSGWKGAEVEDLLFYSAIGVIVGGRLGYVLFYDLGHTLNNPWGVVRGSECDVGVFAFQSSRPLFGDRLCCPLGSIRFGVRENWELH